MQDVNVLDGNAANAVTVPQGWQMPGLPELEMLTGAWDMVAESFGSFFQNVNPAEWALIGSLVFGLLLILRFKVIVHLLLWIIAGGIVIGIAGIIFGVINL
jgi:hypothetical protein